VKLLFAASLTISSAFISANGVEARAHCPAGSYYRVTQGRCVSAQEFRRVVGRVRHYGAAPQTDRKQIHKTEKPEMAMKPIAQKPAIAPQASVTQVTPPAINNFLFESLPPNVQLWEKQYPTQWN
jgi:hypothetical protein